MISLTREDISRACSSKNFAQRLAEQSPFVDEESLLKKSKEIWWGEMSIFDWLEAFEGHPCIGDQHSSISTMSSREQATAAETATEETQAGLVKWNAKYKQRFGHIFLICARGKTSDHILQELKKRYQNNASIELHNAAYEQQKITEQRLLEIVSGRQSQVDRRAGKLAQQLASPAGQSPITTHILDTSHGRPAAGVSIDLEYAEGYSGSCQEMTWTLLGHGRTNKEGRLATLLPDGTLPKAGTYCLSFHVGKYYETCRDQGPLYPFYPVAKVYFTIQPDQIHEHFHVPLTWNPYGYSTYRGS